MFLPQNSQISAQDKVFQAVLHDPSFRQYGFAAASFEYNVIRNSRTCSLGLDLPTVFLARSACTKLLLAGMQPTYPLGRWHEQSVAPTETDYREPMA